MAMMMSSAPTMKRPTAEPRTRASLASGRAAPTGETLRMRKGAMRQHKRPAAR
jgi:hypothetical protein